ncbi:MULTISPECIES: toxin [Aquabacterium]|uniref:toxin n=1 Tax=Aquabacterium TaxID=92793 RepID=UPI000718F85B|nr:MULTISPECIES: toxin [Aquabacterium]
MSKRVPSLQTLINKALGDRSRPVAFVLAGHNGSGKSTLWYERLADRLQIPLVNADRLTMSILPEPENGRLVAWAQQLRDQNELWMKLSQEAVRAFVLSIQAAKAPFAFETVFSHWKRLPDGSYDSKYKTIKELQEAGYFVVLLFVGLANAEISVLRVGTRVAKGGHGVPEEKLMERFSRTQKAIAHAAPLANMTLMFDNSRKHEQAFTLARAQLEGQVLFDCRDPSFNVDQELRDVASHWLSKVAPTA